MSSTVVFTFFAGVVSIVCAGWVEDLTGAGLNVGDSGVKLFLDKDNELISGRSILDQYSLRMGYSGVGISLGKKNSKLDVGVYYNDDNNKIEGRGKKMGELIIPVIMGLKASAIGSIMMAAVGGLVLKSLIFSKLALITSSILGLYKLFGNKKSSGGGHIQPSYRNEQPQFGGVSYEQLQPGFFNHIAPSGYANYAAPLQASASNQAPQYAVLAPEAAINATHHVVNLSPQNLSLKRRHVEIKQPYRNQK